MQADSVNELHINLDVVEAKGEGLQTKQEEEVGMLQKTRPSRGV